MRLTTLFLIVSFFQLQAKETYGQKTKVSINLKKVTIEQVLNKIETLTEFKFLYNYSDLDDKKIVSIKANKKLISSILNDLFENSNIMYEVLGKQIILKEKPKNLISFQTIPIKQTTTIEGTVLEENGQPLPGVNVVQKGTRNGVTTDFDGNYSIKLLPGKEKTLVFSFLGFVTIEKELKEGVTTLNITLKEDTEDLDEIVITGFGGTQKKASLVSSITTISASELKKSPSNNLTNALAGRVAGIVAFQRSGEPGADNSDFFIRGLGTFGSGKQNPLILIDNIESTSTDMARLQPDDIESFSVLKDAAAAAIYGARGANGVVLIVTKGGVSGKTKFHFRSQARISSNTKNFKFADNIRYMNLANEAALTRNPQAVLPYTRSKIERTATGGNPDFYPNNNWIDELIKSNTINEAFNLSASGGGKKARYYIAGTYNIDNGVLKVDKINNFNNNIKLQNYSIRSNVDIDLTPTTLASIRLYGQFDDYNGPVGGGTRIFNLAIWSNPVKFPKIYPSSYLPYIKHPLFGGATTPDGNALLRNPYAEAVNGYQTKKASTIQTQIEIKQDLNSITKGLKAGAMGYIRRYSNYSVSRRYNPFYYGSSINEETGELTLNVLNDDNQGPIGEVGTEYLNYSEGEKSLDSRIYLQATINYNRNFNEKHDVSGMLIGLMSNYERGNAGNLQSSLPSRNLGVSGRFSYGYDSKYLAEFNFGYNGSERFSKGNRFGFFPSFGLGYVISKENFWKPLSEIITNLKIRGTYGLVGNDQIGNTSDRFFYLSNVNLDDGNFSATFGQDFNFSKKGINISRYSNPNIGWEKSEQISLGIDLELFNSFNMVLEAFKQKRTNILQSRSNIGATIGLTATPETNFAKAESKGLDLQLTYNKSFNKNLWTQLRGNFTYSTNKILQYDEVTYSENESYLSRIGKNVNQVYGYIAERLFIDQNEVDNSPQQIGNYIGGDIKYRDVNGDGVINDNDKVPIGKPSVPEIVYGFGGSIGYKNFDINVFFQGVGRTSLFINPENIAPFVLNGTYQNGLLSVISENHWSETNRDSYAFWPRLSDQFVANNNQTSTWWMRNAAFLRLKTVEFGYNIPESFTNKLGIKSIRAYFSGNNLAIWSPFKLWDPEQGGNGLGYPVQTVYNLGLTLDF